MFGPGTSYEHDGFDPDKEPYGTFDRVTVDSIDITVEEGTPLPRRLTRPQPGTLRFNQHPTSASTASRSTERPAFRRNPRNKP